MTDINSKNSEDGIESGEAGIPKFLIAKYSRSFVLFMPGTVAVSLDKAAALRVAERVLKSVRVFPSANPAAKDAAAPLEKKAADCVVDEAIMTHVRSCSRYCTAPKVITLRGRQGDTKPATSDAAIKAGNEEQRLFFVTDGNEELLGEMLDGAKGYFFCHSDIKGSRTVREEGPSSLALRQADASGICEPKIHAATEQQSDDAIADGILELLASPNSLDISVDDSRFSIKPPTPHYVTPFQPPWYPGETDAKEGDDISLRMPQNSAVSKQCRLGAPAVPAAAATGHAMLLRLRRARRRVVRVTKRVVKRRILVSFSMAGEGMNLPCLDPSVAFDETVVAEGIVSDSSLDLTAEADAAPPSYHRSIILGSNIVDVMQRRVVCSAADAVGREDLLGISDTNNLLLSSKKRGNGAKAALGIQSISARAGDTFQGPRRGVSGENDNEGPAVGKRSLSMLDGKGDQTGSGEYNYLLGRQDTHRRGSIMSIMESSDMGAPEVKDDDKLSNAERSGENDKQSIAIGKRQLLDAIIRGEFDCLYNAYHSSAKETEGNPSLTAARTLLPYGQAMANHTLLSDLLSRWSSRQEMIEKQSNAVAAAFGAPADYCFSLLEPEGSRLLTLSTDQRSNGIGMNGMGPYSFSPYAFETQQERERLLQLINSLPAVWAEKGLGGAIGEPDKKRGRLDSDAPLHGTNYSFSTIQQVGMLRLGRAEACLARLASGVVPPSANWQRSGGHSPVLRLVPRTRVLPPMAFTTLKSLAMVPYNFVLNDNVRGVVPPGGRHRDHRPKGQGGTQQREKEERLLLAMAQDGNDDIMDDSSSLGNRKKFFKAHILTATQVSFKSTQLALVSMPILGQCRLFRTLSGVTDEDEGEVALSEERALYANQSNHKRVPSGKELALAIRAFLLGMNRHQLLVLQSPTAAATHPYFRSMWPTSRVALWTGLTPLLVITGQHRLISLARPGRGGNGPREIEGKEHSCQRPSDVFCGRNYITMETGASGVSAAGPNASFVSLSTEAAKLHTGPYHATGFSYPLYDSDADGASGTILTLSEASKDSLYLNAHLHVPGESGLDTNYVTDPLQSTVGSFVSPSRPGDFYTRLLLALEEQVAALVGEIDQASESGWASYGTGRFFHPPFLPLVQPPIQRFYINAHMNHPAAEGDNYFLYYSEEVSLDAFLRLNKSILDWQHAPGDAPGIDLRTARIVHFAAIASAAALRAKRLGLEASATDQRGDALSKIYTIIASFVRNRTILVNEVLLPISEDPSSEPPGPVESPEKSGMITGRFDWVARSSSWGAEIRNFFQPPRDLSQRRISFDVNAEAVLLALPPRPLTDQELFTLLFVVAMFLSERSFAGLLQHESGETEGSASRAAKRGQSTISVREGGKSLCLSLKQSPFRLPPVVTSSERVLLDLLLFLCPVWPPDLLGNTLVALTRKVHTDAYEYDSLSAIVRNHVSRRAAERRHDIVKADPRFKGDAQLLLGLLNGLEQALPPLQPITKERARILVRFYTYIILKGAFNRMVVRYPAAVTAYQACGSTGGCPDRRADVIDAKSTHSGMSWDSVLLALRSSMAQQGGADTTSNDETAPDLAPPTPLTDRSFRYLQRIAIRIDPRGVLGGLIHKIGSVAALVVSHGQADGGAAPITVTHIIRAAIERVSKGSRLADASAWEAWAKQKSGVSTAKAGDMQQLRPFYEHYKQLQHLRRRILAREIESEMSAAAASGASTSTQVTPKAGLPSMASLRRIVVANRLPLLEPLMRRRRLWGLQDIAEANGVVLEKEAAVEAKEEASSEEGLDKYDFYASIILGRSRYRALTMAPLLSDIKVCQIFKNAEIEYNRSHSNAQPLNMEHCLQVVLHGAEWSEVPPTHSSLVPTPWTRYSYSLKAPADSWWGTKVMDQVITYLLADLQHWVEEVLAAVEKLRQPAPQPSGEPTTIMQMLHRADKVPSNDAGNNDEANLSDGGMSSDTDELETSDSDNYVSDDDGGRYSVSGSDMSDASDGVDENDDD